MQATDQEIGKIKTLLISTFIIAVFTYSFWGYVKELTNFSIFYYGTCLSFVGYTLVIKLLLIELYKYNKKLSKTIVFASFVNMVCVNSLVDEVLYDPTKLGINEYIGVVVCFIVATYENRKRFRNARLNE